MGSHDQAHKDMHKSGGGDAFASGDLLEAVVKRIQTTTGPTDLTVGAITDGEFLKRSGSAIVSDTAGGGSPGGPPGELQYNQLGSFGGVSSSYFDGTDLYFNNGINIIPLGAGANTVEVGKSANASGAQSVALGYNAASGSDAVGVGMSANASGNGVIAIGKGAASSYSNTIALGKNSFVGHALSIALGYYASTSAANQLQIGRPHASFDNVTAVRFNDGSQDITFANQLKYGSNYLVDSSGTTGGTGSAGSGNQYVEMTVNGTTYKVLHDGTV